MRESYSLFPYFLINPYLPLKFLIFINLVYIYIYTHIPITYKQYFIHSLVNNTQGKTRNAFLVPMHAKQTRVTDNLISVLVVITEI